MGKFAGKLNTEGYGVQVAELKVAHYNIPAAQVTAADTDALIDGTALGAGVLTLTTFLSQPSCPRNLTMVCSATQTGDAVVNGLDIGNNVISETFTLDSTTPVVGALAFKTVTSVVLPVKAGSETIDIGFGVKYGLPYKLIADELVFVKLFNKAADTGTVVVDASDLAKNVFTLNGTADGAKEIDLYILI